MAKGILGEETGCGTRSRIHSAEGTSRCWTLEIRSSHSGKEKTILRLFLRVVLDPRCYERSPEATKRKLCTTSSVPAFSERACVFIG